MITVQRRFLGNKNHCGGAKYFHWHDWKSFDTKFEALKLLKEKAQPREYRRWEYRLKPQPRVKAN